ncbi:unnamed protein product [Orchesella dallaii]|uniref:CRAL-TRIO domain-containing protein n=1 Tax=Orchesella dallaii TaxID=48710 RepID=A0ABP1RR63_9HEXA
MEIETSPSLQALRNLLSSEDLENIPADLNLDEYLMRFLKFKGDPQRAYETLVKYHKFRNSDKTMFSKMCPNAMKHLIDAKIITKLPGKDVRGNPVILVCCKRWNEKEVSAEDIILLVILFLEEIIRTHGSKVSVVIDWEGYGLSKYRQLTYRNLMRSFELARGTFPISYKAIHQVNQTPTFWLVSKILFSFFSTKLKKRMHLHGNDKESLAAHIPVSSLPTDYGGNSEEYTDAAFTDTLYKNDEYYSLLSKHLMRNSDETEVFVS